MNYFKNRLLIVAVFACLVGLATSCVKEDLKPIDPPIEDPIDPPVDPPAEKIITLTQLSVSLDEPTVLSRASQANTEDENVIKTAFASGDYFSFVYHSPKGGLQTAYAHTLDGQSWTFRQTSDAASALQEVNLDSLKTELKAVYLPLASDGADDGVVVGDNNTVSCYDALQASATAAISGVSASASVSFTHINHLLRFSVEGDASPSDVNYLLLTLAYTDAEEQQLISVLKTTLHTEYIVEQGNEKSVIQAIVPAQAVLQGVSAVFHSGRVLVVANSDNLPANLECPGGNSRLVTLELKNDQLTMNPGTISSGWAESGAIASQSDLAGAIYIANAAQLRAFRDAVNRDPQTNGGKINGIRAYNANVIQTADIDLGGESWTPIAGATYQDANQDDQTTSFAGTYNGNGYKISNLTINSVVGNGASHYAGLFGWVASPTDRSAVLTGIHLRNVTVNVAVNSNYTLAVGALVGATSSKSLSYPTVVSLCSATGSVVVNCTDGSTFAAGLVGNADDTHITRCSVNVSTQATGAEKTSVGGVAGRAKNSLVVSCYAQGEVDVTVTSSYDANGGGIVGDMSGDENLVMVCRADGDVTISGQGNVNAGGLIGAAQGVFVGSYAKGTVVGNTSSGSGFVGAIIGNNFSPGKLALCYGTSANGVGTSRNANSIAQSVVYNTAPAADEILSVVNGNAWADFHDFRHSSDVHGRILTPVSLFGSGSYTVNVQIRLWQLSDLNLPWSAAAQGATSLYPAPVMSYSGQ